MAFGDTQPRRLLAPWEQNQGQQNPYDASQQAPGFQQPQPYGGYGANLPPTPLPPPTPRAPDTGSTSMTVQPGAQPPAATTPPGGYGGAPVGATRGTGDINVEDLLKDPRAAAMAALRSRGINPYGGNPIANAFLKRAPDLANLAVMGMGGGGIEDVVGSLRGSFGAMLDRAIGGQAIFPSVGGGGALGVAGATDPSGLLAQITAAKARVDAGTASMGDRLITQLVQDPQQAAALVANMRYGGQGERLSAIAQRNLQDIAAAYEANVGQQGLESEAAKQGGFLEALLQGLIPPMVQQQRQSTLYGTPGAQAPAALTPAGYSAR